GGAGLHRGAAGGRAAGARVVPLARAGAGRVEGGRMTTVIFACVHNAGRSQMAAAFFNRLADPSKARALSAGTEPGERVHPEVVEVLRELDIDASQAKPQKLTDALARAAQLLITM